MQKELDSYHILFFCNRSSRNLKEIKKKGNNSLKNNIFKSIFVLEPAQGQKETWCQRVSQSVSKWPRKRCTNMQTKRQTFRIYISRYTNGEIGRLPDSLSTGFPFEIRGHKFVYKHGCFQRRRNLLLLKLQSKCLFFLSSFVYNFI